MVAVEKHFDQLVEGGVAGAGGLGGFEMGNGRLRIKLRPLIGKNIRSILREQFSYLCHKLIVRFFRFHIKLAQ